jgi:hypothetical protein
MSRMPKPPVTTKENLDVDTDDGTRSQVNVRVTPEIRTQMRINAAILNMKLGEYIMAAHKFYNDNVVEKKKGG